MSQALQVQVLRPITGTERTYQPGEVHPATEFRNHVSLARLGKLRYCDTPAGQPRPQPAGAPALEATIARNAAPTVARDAQEAEHAPRRRRETDRS